VDRHRNNCQCHIVFPAPKIKTDLDPLQPDFKTIKALTGDHFHSLFHRVVSYEPQDKKTFRDDVSRFLAESAATQLLDLCTSPIRTQGGLDSSSQTLERQVRLRGGAYDERAQGKFLACRHLSARLTVIETSWYLGFSESDIPVLASPQAA